MSEKKVDSIQALINEFRKQTDIDLEDALSKPITCTCKKCQKMTEINREDTNRIKFFRCECGYVVGPILRHVPNMYWYIVRDETNTVEPEKWFATETDAKEYVAFCGLSEEQIHLKYAFL